MKGDFKGVPVVATCNVRTLLLMFSALCVVMTGCLVLYMYHMNEVIDLSIKITNNIREFVNYDVPVAIEAFRNVRDSAARLEGERKFNTMKSVTTTNSNSVSKTHAQTQTRVPTKHVTQQLSSAVPGSRPDDCKECFEHSFKYIIDNPDICKQSDTSVPIELLVLIFTTHSRRKQRDTIRETWMSIAANNTAPKIRYAFLLGGTSDQSLSKQVEEENNIHHDILKEDFKDSYQNLTYKTMMAYKWASTKCEHAQFVMKTDDDMFVNIPAVFRVVRSHKDVLQKTVGGACHLKAVPIRDARSKWYASKKSYPNSHYPGFCSGTGYVTSMNVAKKVFEISPSVPFFHLEDVYVALCIWKLKYSLKPIPGFNSGRVALDPCTYRGNRMVTSHEVPPEMIKKMWKGPCFKDALMKTNVTV